MRQDLCTTAHQHYTTIPNFGIGLTEMAHAKLAASCVPQPSCLHFRLAVDFVVRQEHMEQDLAELMRHLNARQGECAWRRGSPFPCLAGRLAGLPCATV